MGSLFRLLAFSMLVACDSPSPAFLGAAASQHQIGDNTYSVYVKGARAQAIRTNFVRRPDIRIIAFEAETAIEVASGCPVSEIYGDVAVLTGELSCGQEIDPEQQAKFVRPPRRGLTCLGESSASHWGDWQDVALDCF